MKKNTIVYKTKYIKNITKCKKKIYRSEIHCKYFIICVISLCLSTEKMYSNHTGVCLQNVLFIICFSWDSFNLQLFDLYNGYV